MALLVEGLCIWPCVTAQLQAAGPTMVSSDSRLHCSCSGAQPDSCADCLIMWRLILASP